MRKLTNLRHLDITGTGKLPGMPVGMGQLKCLHTLSRFIVSEDSGCGVGELQELDHLGGTLEITCLWKVKDLQDAENAKLSRKENICVLLLDWFKITTASVLESQTNNMNDKLIADALQPHPNIVSLDFHGYGGSDFPRWMNSTCLLSLVTLKLRDCSKCKHLPKLGLLPHLKELSLEGIPVECIGNEFYCDEEEGNNMMKTRGGMVLFRALEKLRLYEMRSLEEWKGWSSSSPSLSPSSSRMKEGEVQVSVFPVLKKLIIWSCPNLRTFPSLPLSIQHLELWDCHEKIFERSLERLPHLSHLSHLSISRFPRWSPDQGMVLLQNLTALHVLGITDCPMLVNLPEGTQSLTSLKSLTISDCRELELLPDDFQNLNALQNLEIIGCPMIVCLPEGMQNLTSLNYLTIESCDGLKSLNKYLQLLTNLHELRIGNCRELELLPYDFQNLVSLQSLHLEALPKLSAVPVAESTLEFISFRTCAGLKNLPEWITNQRSLQVLLLADCKNLKSLPEGFQHLAALRHLEITGCHPELHRRCQNTGEDWHKIAHIPDHHIR